MRTTILLSPLLAGALAIGSYAQTTAPETDLSCVSSLHLPTVGFFAAGAGTSGTVEAVIHIAENDQPATVELSGGNPGLRGEVQVAMDLSHFKDSCPGRTVRIVFAFTLEDPAVDAILPPLVRFIPPNRFELTFQKRKPSLDPASPPRKTPRKKK